MNNNLLPYISSLRSAVDGLASGNTLSFGTAAQGAITARLLDYMLVQETVAKQLKTDCYTAMALLLPEAERLLIESASVPATPRSTDVEKINRGNDLLDALRELKVICTTADIAAFDRFLQLSSKVQSALMALDVSAANAICKAIVDIEASYCHKMEAAVDAQAEASAKANTGNFSVRNSRSYDEQALLGFIRKAFPEETELGIEKSGFISGGTSKFTILITLKNTKSLPTEIVLRGDAGGTFGGASVTYEYRLLKTVYEHGACVPKPLALEETGKVFGSPFMLVERRNGASIGHMQSLPKQPNPALCEDIAAKLAALHRIPADAFGNWISGADMPSSQKVLAWIDEGQRNWLPLETPSTVFSTAFEWLRRNAHINDRAPRTLVHGDYGLNNLLVEGNQVTAILDWEFAHMANPAYDLGYFKCMAEPLSSWEHFLASYEKAGMKLPDEDQLNYATVFATTRLGVMVAQMTRAFNSGAETGLVAAMVTGGSYYDLSVKRIGAALDKVL
jgi:aminoglycoside phosphotransferase (APT) family kinase protein